MLKLDAGVLCLLRAFKGLLNRNSVRHIDRKLDEKQVKHINKLPEVPPEKTQIANTSQSDDVVDSYVLTPLAFRRPKTIKILNVLRFSFFLAPGRQKRLVLTRKSDSALNFLPGDGF